MLVRQPMGSSSISCTTISASPSGQGIYTLLVAKQPKLSESDFGKSQVTTSSEQAGRGGAEVEEANGSDFGFRYLDKTGELEEHFLTGNQKSSLPVDFHFFHYILN